MTRSKIKGLAGLGLIVIVAGLGYRAWNTPPAKSQPKAKGDPVVTTAVLAAQPITIPLPLTGVLAAKESVWIRPAAAGYIQRLHVKPGSQVVAGQPLIDLDDQHQAAAVVEAQATWAEAKRQYEDMARLVAKGAATPSEVQAQHHATEVAAAVLQQARYALTLRRLTAPFAGKVGLFAQSVGERVNPGDALLRIDDNQHLYTDVAIPTRYIAWLSQPVTVQILSPAYPDTPLTGQVTQHDSALAGDQTLLVRLTLNPHRLPLLAGMPVQVTLLFSQGEGLLIPHSSILYQGKQRFVYVRQADGRVKRQAVVLGATLGDRVAVVSGLQPGDELVLSGWQGLSDGRLVTVKKVV